MKYKTKLKKYLDSHTRNKHTVLNPEDLFTCSECNFRSKWKRNLVDHEKIHRNDFIYCNQCEFKTVNNSRLKDHVRNVHEHANKPFRCTKCEYKTKSNKCLRQHVKNVHMILNSEDLYSCNECSFQSKWKRCLVDHKKIHTNDFVYCNQFGSDLLLGRLRRLLHSTRYCDSINFNL